MSSSEARPLRVAHVMSSIAEEAAGPSYTVPALCDALAKAGTHTELHVLEAGPASRYRDHAYPLHVHARSPWLKPIDSAPAMRDALQAGARETDVFHSHGLWRMPGLYAAQIAKRHGRPLVITPRGMLEPAALRFSRKQKRIFWAYGQGRVLHEASCLHATSEGELESIRRLGFRNPIAVITNGVDIPPATTRDVQRSASRTLLYLGRLHPIKALDALLDAWAALEPSFPDWSLRLVGPDENGHKAQLEQQCARLSLRRVSFRGAVFGTDKERELDAASLYVLPSHSENFGMTAAEALAAGLPVIASRGTPWSGLEANGCGGWVQNDAASLAAALRPLLTLPASELNEMGARGRAWMERDFSWRSKAEQMRSIYEWLCGHAETRPSCIETVNGAAQGRNWSVGAWWAAW